MEGVKETGDKLRWSLIPWEAMEGTVRVLMMGAIEKYAPNNWKYVKPQGVYLDAVQRHLVAILKGEEFDNDDGESHMSHLICDALFYEYARMHRDRGIDFETWLESIITYPDYTKEVDKKKLKGATVYKGDDNDV